MKKRNTVLKDFLNIYPINSNRLFAISGVHRITFNRWLEGYSAPPAATLELFRLHATGEPPSTHKEWQGWCFTQGKLFTPCNRGFTPTDILLIPMLYGSHARLQQIEKNYTLQSKLF